SSRSRGGRMSRMRWFYRLSRFACWGFSTFYFKTRCFGVRNLPLDGGVLLVSNHQSFMDPVLATMTLRREGNYMARDSLFRSRWFGWLITHYNSFPVRRSTADIGAIKESMRRLKDGRLMLMFPEGTRTTDGRIGPLLPGMVAIAQKTRVPIVPCLIDGVFQVWPRHQLLPSPGDVIVEYGPPIRPEEFKELSAQELTDLVRGRLVAMQRRWHRLVPRRRLEWYDACEGPADEPGA
ncbi:MAG TPA: lysophospholipid acyltransferase family protein, partial [Phycisphaerae bacterium]|nr:lysophospholipid acyltransferase family protein [Phycisphaerae bacterium]